METSQQPDLRWLRRLRNGLVLTILLVAPWAFACIYPGGQFIVRILGSFLAILEFGKEHFSPEPIRTRREQIVKWTGNCLLAFAIAHPEHGFDFGPTNFAIWGYIVLHALFWAVRDWTREDPTAPRKLLWFILLNAGLIAVVALVHRVGTSRKVLWIYEPEVTSSFFTFGPFEYRALASQFYNLLWPVAVALYLHDRKTSKGTPEVAPASWSASLPRRFSEATTPNQNEELSQPPTQPNQSAQPTQSPQTLHPLPPTQPPLSPTPPPNPSSPPPSPQPPTLFPISLVILLMACPAITGSRGGLLMSLFGLILFSAAFLFRRGPSLIAPRRIVAIALSVVALFALFGIKPIHKRLRETNYNLKTLVSMGGRTEQNENTWRIIADHPLWGVGPGAYETTYRQYHFRNVFKPDRDEPAEMPSWNFFYAKAYNDWLQTLAEWGPLATLAIIIALATILLAPAPPENFLITVGLRVGILTTLVHGSFDYPLQNYAILTHLAVLLALLLPSKSIAEAK